MSLVSAVISGAWACSFVAVASLAAKGWAQSKISAVRPLAKVDWKCVKVSSARGKSALAFHFQPTLSHFRGDLTILDDWSIMAVWSSTEKVALRTTV